jgi:hypothetical protein
MSATIRIFCGDVGTFLNLAIASILQYLITGPEGHPFYFLPLSFFAM